MFVPTPIMVLPQRIACVNSQFSIQTRNFRLLQGLSLSVQVNRTWTETCKKQVYDKGDKGKGIYWRWGEEIIQKGRGGGFGLNLLIVEDGLYRDLDFFLVQTPHLTQTERTIWQYLSLAPPKMSRERGPGLRHRTLLINELCTNTLLTSHIMIVTISRYRGYVQVFVRVYLHDLIHCVTLYVHFNDSIIALGSTNYDM